ncbi:tetratricopeptide repeat-containing sensor histidine kinase [Robiginitalea sp. M366]|uniref:tetratricopeptide repeat-containing sensor histidine kinase n=1 Tax=Robiginitalea aestuariiviva TaxID=3036903 RepID=UPI00240E8994|nr:tetratricopeptide repeat-containing sensor histidine kinase [Robiginitalea aestuariiviva]MDG1572798.1 tetratricopeptide repeat-containing sensor histidine kinase [Robiginitalea aestuariiviva]
MPEPKVFTRYRTGLLTLLLCGCVSAVWPATGSGEDNPRETLVNQIRQMKRAAGFSVKDTAYINRLLELAGESRFYNNDSLYTLASQALDFSRKADYLRGECGAYRRLGDYYSDRGENDKALDYYRMGLELTKTAEDHEGGIKLLSNIAGEYAYKGDYASALNHYLKALELAESHEDLESQSIINENIANLYGDQKDYEQCLMYYKKVKRINNTIGNEVIEAETLSNLASLYADMGQLEYAMFNINQSIDTFEEYRVLDWLAYAYEIKGKIYLKEFNYKWALYWYNQGQLLHEKIEDDRSHIDLLNGMAKAYLGQEQDSMASLYANQAFTLSKKINAKEAVRECSQTLYRIYRKQEDYATALAYHELYQQLSDSLARKENQQSLKLHKAKTDYEQQKSALIAENQQALASQKRYIRVGWVVLGIALVIIYLVYRSNKLQKRLTAELREKKDLLEQRKEELQADNETKTKLFSIIGHDLRGPIGALQGLLKMFKDGEVSPEVFGTFIPKLRADVDHIYFTLNNLLSWGHSQLNGSVTKPAVVSLATLVRENINLLAEQAERKSIRMVSEVMDSTLVWSDPNQVDIVVRNLLSNALKFTPQNGMVTIRAEEKDHHWEVSVRDTGVGMDRVTVENLFRDKNNNTSTYGTDNEKGTGLGLALCKEMVENNKGAIWVESIPRKGSTFYFTLPKSADTYSQAG